MPGLFAAGEDTGGVHKANRLGGNGVTNSTVFGGIAGDTLAAYGEDAVWHDPDEAVIAAAVAAALRPTTLPPGDLDALRESLYACMWDDVGILRDAAGLARARGELGRLERELAASGIPAGTLAYSLTWHDWLNLRNLTSVSQVIVEAALLREDSRGAHFREDFPQAGDPASSTFTVARVADGRVELVREPVRFMRVKPGESLLDDDVTTAQAQPLPAEV